MSRDVHTIRKWSARKWRPQTRRTKKASVLEQFKEFISARGPEVNYNGKVLLREIRAMGYTGSHRQLLRFMRSLRPNSAAGSEAVMRFETAPGKQGQVDWGQTTVWIAGEKTTVHLFTMVLGYSRRNFAQAYRNERIGSLLDGHDRAFEHFGGRPETMLYDNPRTIVLWKDEASGAVEWNGTFKDRLDWYGVEPKLCRYYRAQTKGKVESGVKYVKRNALAGKKFESLEALNEYLLWWCVNVADQRVHGTTGEIPQERFEREERAALQPLVRRPVIRQENRVVMRESAIVVDTNRYPVPVEWIGQEVEVIIGGGIVQIRASADRETLSYERLEERCQTARWSGAPQAFGRGKELRTSEGPPRFDPAYLGTIGEVEMRPVAVYAQLAEEVGS